MQKTIEAIYENPEAKEAVYRALTEDRARRVDRHQHLVDSAG